MTRRQARLAVLGALAVGIAARLPGLWTDFWLDEIWTWELAARLSAWHEVFTALHHSNNHHLNTLLFHWLGPDAAPAWVRGVALVCGAACIPLAAAALMKRSRLEAVLAAWLTAGCFALVHFSSEARGSGPTVACALAALVLLERDLDRPRAARAAGFAACVIAGFLFQLVFCFFWAGALVASGLALRERGEGALRWLAGMARLHGVPLLVFAVLLAVDLRHLEVGGGEPLDVAWLVARGVGSALGLPMASAFAAPWALLAGGLVAAGLWQRQRRGDLLAPLLGVTLVVAPALVIGVVQPGVVAVRYFLIAIAGGLLLLAGLLAAGLEAGGWRRLVAVTALAVFACGNAVHLARFIEHGRGGYRAALAEMARSGPSAIVVGSDHDFRVGSVLRFHARGLAPPTRLDYRAGDAWPAAGPDWLVLHRQRNAGAADPFVVARGHRFRQVADYPHGALSGYRWVLYRNLGAAPRAPLTDGPS